MLGAIAAKEAVQSAGISTDGNTSIGFINSTTVGGMDMIEKYYRDFLDQEELQHYIEVHDAGSNTDLIAEHLGIQGFVTTRSEERRVGKECRYPGSRDALNT